MAEILGAMQHPLSICGLALILVFRLLKKRMLGQHPSLYPLAMAMAVIALVGGLALTSWDIANRSPTPPETMPAATQTAAGPEAPPRSLKQTTEDEQNPNIANTEGDVNVPTPEPPPRTMSPTSTPPESAVRQESTGANSPNIVTMGPNSPVTTGPDSPITINPDVNPNKPVTTYDCVGNSRVVSPGVLGGTFGDIKPFNDMIALLNSRDYSALLSRCERELELKPEWLTPYLFCSSAHLGLGNIDRARKMFAHYESETGPAYDHQDCQQIVLYLQKEVTQ